MYRGHGPEAELVGIIRLTSMYLFSPMNREAVTPQKSSMMDIPLGLEGFHGSSTLTSRSMKYDPINTENIIGNPRYIM